MNLSPKTNAALRWLLLIPAGIATLLAVFVEIENWRGDRAWAAAEKELKAKGELIDLAALPSPAIPKEQNLFATPQLAPIFADQPDNAEEKKLLAETRLMDYDAGFGLLRSLNDFSSVRDRLKKTGLLPGPVSSSPAADVLIAMKPLQPLLDELCEAARLQPEAVLTGGPDHYDFDLNAAFQLGKALDMRALAEIELGQIDDAYADIFALQRFANGLMEHPATLLAVLVGEALQGIAVAAISDGCERQIWSEPRLAQFQKSLSKLHPLADFREAYLSGLAYRTHLLDTQTKAEFGHGSTWPPWWLFHGWAQQNKVSMYRHSENEILSTFTADPDRIFPERRVFLKKTTGALTKFYSPYEWLWVTTKAPFAELLENFGKNADKLKLFSVSWAIERYRLAHGRYPETLDELVPAFLNGVPNGIFDGRPFRYTKLPKGGHQIYTAGQSGRDEGGTGDDIVLKLPDVPSPPAQNPPGK